MKRHSSFLVKFAETVAGKENWIRLKKVFWDELIGSFKSRKEFRATLKSK